jgi:hypothetical protein
VAILRVDPDLISIAVDASQWKNECTGGHRRDMVLVEEAFLELNFCVKFIHNL